MHIIFLITLTVFKDMLWPIGGLPVFSNGIQTKSEKRREPESQAVIREHLGVGHLRYVLCYKYMAERKQNTQINMPIGFL